MEKLNDASPNKRKKGGGKLSKLWKAGQSIYKREEGKWKASRAAKKEEKLRKKLIAHVLSINNSLGASFLNTFSTSQLSELEAETERKRSGKRLPTREQIFDRLHTDTSLPTDMAHIIADMSKPVSWCKDQKELNKYQTRLKRYGVRLDYILNNLSATDLSDWMIDHDSELKLEPDQVVMLVDNADITPYDPESRLFPDLNALYKFLTSTSLRKVKYFNSRDGYYSRKRYNEDSDLHVANMDEWLLSEDFWGRAPKDTSLELFKERLIYAEEPYFYAKVLHCSDLELAEKVAKYDFDSRKGSSTGR